MTAPRIITGGCHCGNLAVEATLTDGPQSCQPRACDCDFCRMHGASYVSDPKGRLRIRIRDAGAVGRYRMGSGRAEMLFCSNCGVVVGVCYQESGKLFGAVNTRVLDGEFGAATIVSPQRLSPDEKTERWRRLWFADVQIE